MLILGIETSCDDTGVAILEVSGKKRPVFKILSNIVSSQVKVHAKYGGVVPNLAAREHLKNIKPCLKQAFKEAKIKPEKIDLIAVTIGPGLIPSLLIGVHFAKTLAYKWKKPIIEVNHLEGHIIAALAATNPKSPARLASQREAGRQILNPKQLFPAIALLVSGGHTQLVLVKDIGQYRILGETRDDAAGECFDKVAKLLGLEYPGGPAIARMAIKSEARSTKSPSSEAELLRRTGETNTKYKILNTKYEIKLPRPMINHKNYDFSFSGLKTAVLYLLNDIKQKCPFFYDRRKKGIDIIPELCCETQQAIIDVLIDKTLRAAKEYKVKTIILSGGVAANNELREQFTSNIKHQALSIKFLVPPKILCTDNAAMIAMAGYFNKDKTCPADAKRLCGVKANANLRLS